MKITKIGEFFFMITVAISTRMLSKRDAKEISKFRIFTDRHHWKNHTGCSESYNSDQYHYLKQVNTQICEQKNRSLRKLSSTLAYCSFKNYQNKVKLFFIMNNYEEKGVL